MNPSKSKLMSQNEGGGRPVRGIIDREDRVIQISWTTGSFGKQNGNVTRSGKRMHDEHFEVKNNI